MSKNSELSALAIGGAALIALGAGFFIGNHHSSRSASAPQRGLSAADLAQLCAPGVDVNEDSDDDSVTEAALDSSTLSTHIYDLRRLKPAEKARLKSHMSGLQQFKVSSGSRQTMGEQYAQGNIDAAGNNFVFTQKTVYTSRDETTEQYVGMIIGHMGPGIIDGERGAIVNIKVVLAKSGKGDPLMKQLVWADLPLLSRQFANLKVAFILESVPERVPFYQRLHFGLRQNAQPQEAGCVPMVLIKNFGPSIQASPSPTSASSSSSQR